jgi:pyruvate/2-oxoglutarate dehydrogenase complex dihydrolipoamide dehydrogenase (E3) component
MLNVGATTSAWRSGRPMSGRLENVPAAPQFTHVSFDDFRIIRDNLAEANRTTRDRLIPYCVFTDPQLALVGLSEGDAQRQVIKAPSRNCQCVPCFGRKRSAKQSAL